MQVAMLVIMLTYQMHSFSGCLLGGLNASGLLNRFPLTIIVQTLRTIAARVKLSSVARERLERRSLPTQGELGLFEMSMVCALDLN